MLHPFDETMGDGFKDLLPVVFAEALGKVLVDFADRAGVLRRVSALVTSKQDLSNTSGNQFSCNIACLAALCLRIQHWGWAGLHHGSDRNNI